MNRRLIAPVAAVLVRVCLARAPQVHRRSPRKLEKGSKTMKFILMMHMKTDPESLSKAS